MAEYISKENIITELTKRIDNSQKDLEIAHHKELEDYFEGYHDALSMFRDFINALEVKNIVNHEPSVKSGLIIVHIKHTVLNLFKKVQDYLIDIISLYRKTCV